MNAEVCEDEQSSQDDVDTSGRRVISSCDEELKPNDARSAAADVIERELCEEVDGEPGKIDGEQGEVDDESVPLFFFMDCEASSGVPYRHDIVEIAIRCWPYKETVEDSLFYSLIHTSKYLCKFALRHGFTKKLLRNQPSFKDVMNKLFDWLKKTTTTASQYLNVPVFPVLLCHGGEGFDYLMMFSQLQRTGMSFQKLEEINLHFADTYPHLNKYQMAKHPLLVSCGSLGIENLQEQWFGRRGKGFHRAQVDVEAMMRLFTQTPLYSFLQDIPIYTTADWIEYYEEKKNQNKTKRELEEKLPSSINGIQKKFTIKKLLQNGLGMDSMRTLYMECTEPHHFRQELVDLEVKGTIASKLMMHFFNQHLLQTGTKEYGVKITENMQLQKWTTRTNVRVLPPIIPSGGSGFDFDDATAPSPAEELKDLMKSFAKFQLQMGLEPAVSGERTAWVIPPEFWNNIPVETETKYTIDEDKDLPKWEETEQDWQSEVVDNFKRSPLLPTPSTPTKLPTALLPTPNTPSKRQSPLLPTPTELPTSWIPTPVATKQRSASSSYGGYSQDNGDVAQRPHIPWDEIRQEAIKAKQEQHEQFNTRLKHGWENMEFTNNNYRKGKTSKWKKMSQKPDCYEQWYEAHDNGFYERRRQIYYGPTAHGRGHTSRDNDGHAVQANNVHSVQVSNGHVAQPNYRKYSIDCPRNGMGRNQWFPENQSNTRNKVSGANQNESQQGARKKTYFKYQRNNQGKQNN